VVDDCSPGLSGDWRDVGEPAIALNTFPLCYYIE